MQHSITEAMVTWLAGLGYRASTFPPKDGPRCPKEFVTVERTGGSVEDMVDHPELAIQAWAPTDERAERIAGAIRLAALTGGLPQGVHSLRVDAGPYRFYDEHTRCPRYQLVLSATSQLTTNLLTN